MRNKILILGKIPPPYFGPAIATSILLNSDLKNKFHILHLDTRAYRDIHLLGKWKFSKINQNLSIYKKLIKIIKKHRPELVLIPISQTTIGFIKDSFFIIICKVMSTRVLIQLRGSNFKTWVDNANFIVRIYVKKILTFTHGVIVLGEKLKYLFKAYFDSERIYVAPNGANYNIPSRTNESDTTINLLYLANLQSSKGILDVIDAIKGINGLSTQSFRLDVIGNWRDEKTKQYCEKTVAENKLPVHFHGPLIGKNKFQFLANADIFVFPPRMPEGHPWVIIEAMACGLPILSTDQGAITESVINGHNGFIVNSESPYGIADKIIELFNDPLLRQQMGENSRKLYNEHYNESSLVSNYSDIFLKVLQTAS